MMKATLILQGLAAVSSVSQPESCSMTQKAEPTYRVSINGRTFTPEELEYEAAMRVAASYNLPNDKLLALAKKYPPPQEWFDSKEECPF